VIRSFHEGRGPLVLLFIAAIVAAACGTSTSTNSATPGSSSANQQPSTAVGPVNSGVGGLGGTGSKFAGISSYKLKMTVLGGTLGDLLAPISAGTSDTPANIDGTFLVKPNKAYDLNFAGAHMIGIGGFVYTDLFGVGAFTKTPATAADIGDALSPAKIFGTAIDTSNAANYTKVAEEPKNGVAAIHYTAGQTAAADLASSFGATGATTSSVDVWIAKDGGYPMSLAIVGKAANKTTVFQVSFDITNINDSANQVTAPAV
jgi:hypothetical protein